MGSTAVAGKQVGQWALKMNHPVYEERGPRQRAVFDFRPDQFQIRLIGLALTSLHKAFAKAVSWLL